MKYEANAVNFSYLLLEYYKFLNLDEKEVMVILMIDHLLSSQNDFVTVDLLSLKMNLDESQLDNIMASLIMKKYVEYKTDTGKAKTSIEPIKRILYRKFQESVLSEEELSQKEDIEDLIKNIYTTIEEGFGRTLNPIEQNRIDQWLKDEIDEDIILNSIKDALIKEKYSITYIDRLILKKLNIQQNG